MHGCPLRSTDRQSVNRVIKRSREKTHRVSCWYERRRRLPSHNTAVTPRRAAAAAAAGVAATPSR